VPTISVDDDDLDELVYELVVGDGDAYEIGREIIELSLDYDSAIQAECIEAIAQNTDYIKSTIRDWKTDIEADRSRRLIEVQSISKIIPHSADEPVVFEFEVVGKGGEEATFRIQSDDLMSSAVFERKVLELTNTRVSFDDWQGLLNDWLNEHEIEERLEEPISKEHAVVESVINRMRGMDPTDDMDEFRRQQQHIFVDVEGREAQVPGSVVQAAAREVRGETVTRKIRAILDPLMIKGKSRKVRIGDDYFRAWRFDLDDLLDAGVVDISPLVDDDDDDDDAEGGDDID